MCYIIIFNTLISSWVCIADGGDGGFREDGIICGPQTNKDCLLDQIRISLEERFEAVVIGHRASSREKRNYQFIVFVSNRRENFLFRSNEAKEVIEVREANQNTGITARDDSVVLPRRLERPLQKLQMSNSDPGCVGEATADSILFQGAVLTQSGKLKDVARKELEKQLSAEENDRMWSD